MEMLNTTYGRTSSGIRSIILSGSALFQVSICTIHIGCSGEIGRLSLPSLGITFASLPSPSATAENGIAVSAITTAKTRAIILLIFIFKASNQYYFAFEITILSRYISSEAEDFALSSKVFSPLFKATLTLYVPHLLVEPVFLSDGEETCLPLI